MFKFHYLTRLLGQPQEDHRMSFGPRYLCLFELSKIFASLEVSLFDTLQTNKRLQCNVAALKLSLT